MTLSPSFNLLTEDLIGCRTGDGVRQHRSLPAVLALLADPRRVVESFTALQAHQAHAWHAFMVQLAAMVCQRADVSMSDTACQDETWWRERLRALAGGDAAWSLLVEDLRQPAFMQSAVPEGKLDLFGRSFFRPDDFDVLVATKNHDRKAVRSSSSIEIWLTVLITSQTMQGFSGRANYGVFRMNGGFGNRPGIGFARPDDLAAWFRADVAALLASRDEVLEHGFTERGHPLLWALPWDGKASLPLNSLDPWCIECCRRVRLVSRDGALVLVQAPTVAARVDAPEELTGNVGDPWTPVAKADGKALTLPGEGFSYRRAQDLLFSVDWTQPATQRDPGAATAWVARTLVRGQGKTDGFHERHIPISATVRNWLADPDQRSRLAERAKGYVEDVKNMRSFVLWPALKALNGEHGDPPEGPLTTFEADADAHFFLHLLDESHRDDAQAARRSWQGRLRIRAEDLLDQAIATASPGSARRWRRIAEARSRFQHGLWTHFISLMEASRPEAYA